MHRIEYIQSAAASRIEGLPSEELEFARRLADVEERIHKATQGCGRKRQEITLLAVSKKFPAERLDIAYQPAYANLARTTFRSSLKSAQR